MKKQSKRAPSWDDVIFKRDSKYYGAYILRKFYGRHLFRALLISVVFTGLVLSVPAISKLVQEEQVSEVQEQHSTIKYTELAPPPPIERIKPPEVQKVYHVPPVRKVVKFVPPKVTASEVQEKEDMPTVEETRENITGAESVEGEADVDYIEPVMDEVVDDREEDVVFEAVEKAPQFEGGLAALAKYLQRNLRYPSRSKEKKTQGTVYVKFVIDADGKIRDVTVTRGLDQHCDREAVRVIERMPQWKPGVQNGRAVKVWQTIPITFVYRDV